MFKDEDFEVESVRKGTSEPALLPAHFEPQAESPDASQEDSEGLPDLPDAVVPDGSTKKEKKKGFGAVTFFWRDPEAKPKDMGITQVVNRGSYGVVWFSDHHTSYTIKWLSDGLISIQDSKEMYGPCSIVMNQLNDIQIGPVSITLFPQMISACGPIALFRDPRSQLVVHCFNVGVHSIHSVIDGSVTIEEHEYSVIYRLTKAYLKPKAGGLDIPIGRNFIEHTTLPDTNFAMLYLKLDKTQAKLAKPKKSKVPKEPKKSKPKEPKEPLSMFQRTDLRRDLPEDLSSPCLDDTDDDALLEPMYDMPALEHPFPSPLESEEKDENMEVRLTSKRKAEVLQPPAKRQRVRWEELSDDEPVSPAPLKSFVRNIAVVFGPTRADTIVFNGDSGPACIAGVSGHYTIADGVLTFESTKGSLLLLPNVPTQFGEDAQIVFYPKP